jgi:hypothetical protein
VIQLIKKCIAWIFFHIAIAKKYRRFFCPFDRNIAGNIAKISENIMFFRRFYKKKIKLNLGKNFKKLRFDEDNLVTICEIKTTSIIMKKSV